MKRFYQSFVFVIAMCFLSAMADQAAYITREDAERAVELLKSASELKFYCAPCGDKLVESVSVKTIASADVNYEGYWEVRVNGSGIDLAYTYFPVGGKWRNAAMALNIPVAQVSEFLELQRAPESKPSFPLKWKVKTGLSTFRTTLLYANGKILMPSNGSDLGSLMDSADGVYVIDGKTGQIERQIVTGKGGDLDVNGVAVYKDRLFFGNDNNEFFSYDFQGRKNWSISVKGDIEGAPAITDLNDDQEPDVIFATEAGELYAVNGATGKTIWWYQTQWESGTDKYEFYSSKAFIASPTLYDLSGDGVSDVLIGARNATFYVFNGVDGEIFWKYHTGSGIHSSAFLDNRGSEPLIVISESYSDVHFLSLDGKLKHKITLGLPGAGIQGLFSSPITTSLGNLCIGTSWWGERDGFYCFSDYRTEPYTDYTQAGTVSASPIYADLVDDDANPEVGIVTEGGDFYILDDFGKIISRFELPAGVEATPLVADIDNDGLLELLIAGLDQYLYAYDLPTSGKTTWAQFRGNNFNTGVYFDERAQVGRLPGKKTPLQAAIAGAKGPVGGEVRDVVPRSLDYKRYGRKTAVVVGVADYKSMKPRSEETQVHRLVDLNYADDDAEAFEKFLKDENLSGGGWEIHSFIGPRAERVSVQNKIDQVLSEARHDDLVYLFFSGHGRHATYNESEIYLLTYDAEYDDGYSGIPYNWLRDKIEESKAEHIITFIDACRSGTIGYGKGTGGNPNAELMGTMQQSTKPNKLIFTSGHGTEQAFEDPDLKLGIFTYYILQGLRGKAGEIRKDGYVDIGELRDYVATRVSEHTKNNNNMALQRPSLWESKGLIEENFPVAVRQ